jgi:hypothetical protein
MEKCIRSNNVNHTQHQNTLVFEGPTLRQTGPQIILADLLLGPLYTSDQGP